MVSFKKLTLDKKIKLAPETVRAFVFNNHPHKVCKTKKKEDSDF